MLVKLAGLAAPDRYLVERHRLVIIALGQVIEAGRIVRPEHVADADVTGNVRARVAGQIRYVQLAARRAVLIDIGHAGHTQDISDLIALRRQSRDGHAPQLNDFLE